MSIRLVFGRLECNINIMIGVYRRAYFFCGHPVDISCNSYEELKSCVNVADVDMQ